jgi:uncharacterized protein YjbI with pentapeptide repeats
VPASPLDDRELFEDETFTELDLAAQVIAGKEFVRCTFRNLKLGATRWPASIFEDCIFDDCDLARMVPAQMRLRGVEFRRSRLMGIDWTDVAKNPELRFVDCNVRYASFVGTNLRKTEFLRCALNESNFVSADLCAATFPECDLTGASFSACDLTKADLSGARGLFLDPTKNRVKGLRVPLELAVLLAESAGMIVAR